MKSSNKRSYGKQRFGMTYSDLFYRIIADRRWGTLLFGILFFIAVWISVHYAAECGSTVSLFNILEYSKKCPEKPSSIKKAALKKGGETASKNPFSPFHCALLIKDHLGKSDGMLSEKLAFTMQENGITTSLLSQSLFKTMDAFHQTYGGDKNRIDHLNAKYPADYYLLGKRLVSFSSSPDLENLITASISLSLNVIDGDVCRIVDHLSLLETGPGFSEAAALQAAAERVSQQFDIQLKRLKLEKKR